MERAQMLALQNIFGRMKAIRICKGIQNMNKQEYTHNIKLINRLCKQISSVKHR